MQITEAVLHRIEKISNTHGPASTTPVKASACLPIDDVLKQLCQDLRGLIEKTYVGYGTLGKQTMFPSHLDAYSKKEKTFMDMTSDATDLLAHETQKSNFATGGYAFFVRYTYNQQDYVLIAMLKIRPGAGIDDALQLQETLTIDLSKLHEAARINLTRREATEQPYLTFAKGKRSEDVTEYFREALSCSDYTDSKSQTTKAIEAARAYVSQRANLNESEKKQEEIEVRRRLVDCFDAVGNGEVSPDSLANAIAPNNSDDFKEFLAKDGNAEKYGLNTPFKPHKGTYNKLRRITGTMGTVRVAFNVEDVSSGNVFYDSKNDAIVLKNPGQELVDKISEHSPDSNKSA